MRFVPKSLGFAHIIVSLSESSRLPDQMNLIEPRIGLVSYLSNTKITLCCLFIFLSFFLEFSHHIMIGIRCLQTILVVESLNVKSLFPLLNL